jgi:hypothetical protein
MAVGSNLKIQYNERMTGENHPTRTDTLNRLMAPDHEQDGHHKWVMLHENANQSTGADQFLLLAKNDGTQTELYGRSESDGTVFQITKDGKLYTSNNVCIDSDMTIGTNNNLIVTPARAQRLVYRDGTRALTADWDIGEGFTIHSEKFAARSSAGLRLEDDAGNLGVFIEDGGQVGIANSNPGAALHVTGDQITTGYNKIGYGASTAATYLQIGAARTDNGYAYFDLIGDTTYPSYGFRFIRGNTGANASTTLLHRGTGHFIFQTEEAAEIRFYTNDALRMAMGSTGNMSLSNGENLGIGSSSIFGTNAANVLSIYNSTAPTTAPTDAVQLYAADANGTAGKKTLHQFGEIGETEVICGATISTAVNPTNARFGLFHFDSDAGNGDGALRFYTGTQWITIWIDLD